MNRRVFLKGVGGVSLAAPFLPSVEEYEDEQEVVAVPAVAAEASSDSMEE